MKRYIVLVLGLVFVAGSVGYAQGVTKVGTTSANFLGIDVGPRGTAMGSAYVSVANDATAMYWNPAGIARLSNFQAVFSNTRWIADLTFNYAGVVVPLGDFGNIGVNATFLTMDQIERTTIVQPDGTGELFDAASYAVGLSYGRKLSEQFSIGLNAKFIDERLYHSDAIGFGLDVGAQFNTHFNGLMLGMSISNYGTKMQLDGRDMQIQYDIDQSVHGNNQFINARLQADNFDLPLLFRVGVSMDILKGGFDSNLILSVDALHPNDDAEFLNIGGEYIFHDMLSLRGGYKGLAAKDSEQRFSVGGGIRYNIRGTTTFHFDYAYTDFGVFKGVNTFSVGLEL